MDEPKSSSYHYSVTPDVEIEEEPLHPTVSSQLCALRPLFVFILAFVVFSFFFRIDDRPFWPCAYLIALMAIFWITEAIPIAVTSLLPVFLCPMMGILTAKETSASYMTDTSMLFVGGLIIAIAIETWHLHTRIALAVLLLCGSDPKWIMAGLMSVTWFLSMWISNTATTAMMMPIAQAILQQLKDGAVIVKTPVDGIDNEGFDTEMDEIPNSNSETKENKTAPEKTAPERTVPVKTDKEKSDDARHLRVCKALSLSIAYAANTGGIASLTGTGPNIVLKGQSDIVFDKYDVPNPITFANWMVYGLPLSFIVLIVLWCWLLIVFLRCRGCCSCCSNKKKDTTVSDNVRKIIIKAYKDLGPVSFAQYVVMIMFLFLVILWITRDLGGQGGWGQLFKEKMVSDSTPAILIGVLLFVLPSTPPNIFCFRKRNDSRKSEYIPILVWKNIHEKMPWSLYLLLGGGFALAKAATVSGLSKAVGEFLTVFKDLNPWLILLILCYIITFFTEVTSNTAIATLMMPILAELAKVLKVNPLLFMFPATLTTSFAFMLPAATPPNAIVFSYGQVKVYEMAAVGLFMNIVSVPILIGATATWGNAFFHFDTLPDGFNISSSNT